MSAVSMRQPGFIAEGPFSLRDDREAHGTPDGGQVEPARGPSPRVARQRSSSRVYPPEMTSPIVLGSPLSLEALEAVARRGHAVVLGDEARSRMAASRAAIDAIAEEGDESALVYGVNTGFGALSETRIGEGDVCRLQQNLVRSHSTGVGPPLGAAEVRGMLLLRAQVLALGQSGVRPAVVDTLIAMLNG